MCGSKQRAWCPCLNLFPSTLIYTSSLEKELMPILPIKFVGQGKSVLLICELLHPGHFVIFLSFLCSLIRFWILFRFLFIKSLG